MWTDRYNLSLKACVSVVAPSFGSTEVRGLALAGMGGERWTRKGLGCCVLWKE